MRIIKLNILITCLFAGSSLLAQSLSDTLQIDEVVVSGMRVEVSRKNLPVNVSVIPRDKIDEIEESAVLPLVSRMIPSLFVNERGVTGFGRTGSSSAGNITVRGVGGNPNSQVLVLVDGHPQYMGIFGHPLANNYVASDLERVEVIRGPASILYGSNAMGGVLNFITREQKEDGFSGSMRMGVGSFNTNKLMVNTGFRKGKFDFFVSYNHDETDGHRENMDFRIDNSYIKAGYSLNDHIKLTADFNIADMRSLDPGMDDSIVPVFRADMVRGKASVSLSNEYRKAQGAVFAFMNFGEHDFSDGWRSTDENFGISAFEGIKLFRGNLITVGFDYKSYGGKGSVAFPPMNANKWLEVNETGAYLVARQNLIGDKIVLSAGARYEDHSLFGSQLIPQAGIAAHLLETFTVKSSYSKGYRSPTIMELYLFAPNPDLKPEISDNYEFGFDNSFFGGMLNTSITGYIVKGSNLIEMDFSNAPPPSRKNTGEFNHKGIELELNYRPQNNMNIDMSFSRLFMDKPKLAAPEIQIFGGANYKFDKLSIACQVNYVGGLYIATEDTENVNMDILENYLVVNASVKYRVINSVELFLSGKNLLNTGYMIDYGYPMPGINIMTGVGIHF